MTIVNTPYSVLRSIYKKLKPKLPPVLPFPHVEHFFWRPGNGSMNFGDHLSSIVVRKMLADHNRSLEEEVAKPSRLLAIGSILHFARAGDVIWGSGINGKIDPSLFTADNSLDVRAVRGPLTRKFLLERGISCPEIYGDPALLLPRLFSGRFKHAPQRKKVVVPNLHDLELMKDWSDVISPLDGWNVCIKSILSAERVIASSLHGLIIAEAFGVPAIYLRVSESEGMFKYQDYAQGTGRESVPTARTLDEAVSMPIPTLSSFDTDALMSSFPYDLWTL